MAQPIPTSTGNERGRELLQAALGYAARGWPVIPLHTPTGAGCSCHMGTRCQSVGKHPRLKHWRNEASCDPAVIERWWTAWPDANVGIVTGFDASGLVVVDIDKNKGGDESWYALVEQYGEDPDTPTVITGSGGGHLYYKAPGFLKSRSPMHDDWPGVDIKATGGYVVAPPSRNAYGEYTWDALLGVDEVEVAVLPAWIAGLVEKPAGTVESVGGVPDVIRDGSRREAFLKVAGALRRQGLTPEEILPTLLAMNRRCETPAPEEHLQQIARSMMIYPPEPDGLGPRLVFSKNGHSTNGHHPPAEEEEHEGFRTVPMSAVQPEPIDWIWEGFLARRKFVLWEGDPGVGKTFALCAVGAAITRGWALPGGEAMEPANVMLLTVEDDLPDTIRPRLDQLGADLDRFYAYDEPLVIEGTFMSELSAEIERVKPVLVIIDPIMAFIPGKLNIYKPNEIRTITTPLRMLAKMHGCAIVGIRHLTKADKQKAIYRGNGGMDWVGASRLVVLVGNDPDNPGQKAIVQTKANIGTTPQSVNYSLTPDEGFQWVGQTNVRADRLLAAGSTQDDEQNALEEAREFLEEYLGDGPKTSKEVALAALEMDIKKTTLMRARRAMRISVTRHAEQGGRGKGYWLWALYAAGPKLAE